jgi:hypothetical protein
MVSSILWYLSARRAAFHRCVSIQCFGQRVNRLAWRIAILPFEKLVHMAPATLAPGSGHFPFMGGEQRSGES